MAVITCVHVAHAQLRVTILVLVLLHQQTSGMFGALAQMLYTSHLQYCQQGVGQMQVSVTQACPEETCAVSINVKQISW